MTTPDVPAERGRDELRERATKLAQGYLNYPQSIMLRDDILALLAQREAPAEGISLSAQLSQAAAWMRVWDECQRLGMDTYGAPSTRTGLDIVLDFIRGHAAPQEAREPDIEALAEAVHDAYLATCARLGWDVKPANRVPYAELSEDSKELDRASVRAVLAGLAAARPAPETREPELLGYVVERQLTTGEWMRVWRGRTMWFDHDEAVLDRDAYALDGIPAHIRPVYLGAPAPEEATERSES